MKKIVIECPKCHTESIYRNYWEWVWHNPFHYFGKRKTICPMCGLKHWARPRK